MKQRPNPIAFRFCPPVPRAPPRGIQRDLLGLTLAAACWGLGTVVSKRALDELATRLLPQHSASLMCWPW